MTPSSKIWSGHSLIGEGIVPDVELSLPEGVAMMGDQMQPLVQSPGCAEQRHCLSEPRLCARARLSVRRHICFVRRGRRSHTPAQTLS